MNRKSHFWKYATRRSISSCLLILALQMFVASITFAQDGNEVFVIGPDGSFIMVEVGGQGVFAPIIMNNDGQILGSGDVDCGQTPDHPQCLTLHYLQGVTLDKQEQAPGAVVVMKPGALVLTTVAPSTYPPPVVFVDGHLVNCLGLVRDPDLCVD